MVTTSVKIAARNFCGVNEHQGLILPSAKTEKNPVSVYTGKFETDKFFL
jgi:hypothetical protein